MFLQTGACRIFSWGLGGRKGGEAEVQVGDLNIQAGCFHDRHGQQTRLYRLRLKLPYCARRHDLALR